MAKTIVGKCPVTGDDCEDGCLFRCGRNRRITLLIIDDVLDDDHPPPTQEACERIAKWYRDRNGS